MLLAVLGFFFLVPTVFGFMDLSETEHSESHFAPETSDAALIAQARALYDKMKEGIGGSTVAFHFPSERRFVHRNTWMMICHGRISRRNGNCNGKIVETVSAFLPNEPEEYCFVKKFRTLNDTQDTLCLSPYEVFMFLDKTTDKYCQGGVKSSPALAITTKDYLDTCRSISDRVVYLYISNRHDRDRVPIPNENPYVKCQNNVTSLMDMSLIYRKVWLREIGVEIIREGICMFFEEDKAVLKVLNYARRGIQA